MLTRSRLYLIATILLMILLALSGWLWRQHRQLDRSITENRARSINANLLIHQTSLLTPVRSPGIRLWHRATAIQDIVRFRERYYAASEGGLLEFDTQGQLLKQYTTLDGLPVNHLTALAQYNGQLWLGANNGQIIVFNGDQFISYQLDQTTAALQRITSITPLRDQLAINTVGLGTIIFDGERFTTLRDLPSRNTGIVTMALATAEADYLATYANGLWIKREGHWLHTTTNEGLPSNRVVNVAAIGDQVFVGSDFGVARLTQSDSSGDKFAAQPLIALPGLADLIAFQDQIYLCRDNGDLYSFPIEAANSAKNITPIPIERRWPLTQGCRLKVIDNNLFLLTTQGIWVKTGTGEYRDFRRFDRSNRALLSDNMIAALAVDREDRVWVGLFAHGIDILAPTGELIKHLETEAIREVNNLRWDERSGRMLAATSAGLFEFDLQFHYRALTDKESVISNNISQVNLVPMNALSPYRRAVAADDQMLAIATARGLSIGLDNNFHSYTTVQGLPSNSVYNTAQMGSKLYVGTLSGIAVMEGGRITRTYSNSNSDLSANWVTALHPVNNRLFIGTYGGGLDLIENGELRHLQSKSGRFVVNLNAISHDDRNLYIGTLAEGCWLFDLKTEQWQQLKRGLPSPNVMAVTMGRDALWLGTEQGLVKVSRKELDNLVESGANARAQR